MQKKVIFYEDRFAEVGGVETHAYNWCLNYRNYYDITVLHGKGIPYKWKHKLQQIVKVEEYDPDKQYECDILIRNSLYWVIPYNIKANWKLAYNGKEAKIEMDHADYMELPDNCRNNEMEGATVVACGEFASQQYEKWCGKKIPFIRNVLAPKIPTKKVLRFIICSRIDSNKGWDLVQDMLDKLRKKGIKFTLDIFTNAKLSVPEEVHLWSAKDTDKLYDYIASSDYLILLSRKEGLPYTLQEALQYGTPCIVTDIGGCTELIKDGKNGYVIPLVNNKLGEFDWNRLYDIPVFEEYKGTDINEWLDFIGGAEYIEKEIDNMDMKVKAVRKYKDVLLGRDVEAGEEFEVDKARADYLSKDRGLVEIIGEVKEPVIEEAVKEVKKETAKKKTNAKK